MTALYLFNTSPAKVTRWVAFTSAEIPFCIIHRYQLIIHTHNVRASTHHSKFN